MASFTNKATLSYNGITKESNVVTGEITGALSVLKTALTETYGADDAIAYVVTLVNEGAADITVSLTDDLGAYDYNGAELVPLTYIEDSLRYFADGALMPEPQITVGPGLTVAGITVPAGGSAAIAYTARVNAFAPLGEDGTIENTVSAATQSSTVSASETVTAVSGPALEIEKSLSPAAVSENGELTYTFVIRNSGGAPADETAEIVLSDTFDPVLKDIAAAIDGAPLSEGTDYTYDETTGELATLPGVITVPAAAFTRDETTGAWCCTPGTTAVTIKGTI